MSSVNKNIIANILGKGWSMFSVFIFIPIYINILGVKLYGIVGFYAILQGILIFADAGLTATLRREMSKGSNSTSDRAYKYKILRSIEFVYFFIVALIISGIVLLSDFIVTQWLNIEDLEMADASNAVKLMGIALGLNFLSSLYQGGLLGLEKQVASNVLRFLWGIVKNGGVILVILFYEKTLFAFFTWQWIINLIYVLLLRQYLLKELKKDNVLLWVLKKDISTLNHIWKYAAGMFIIAVIASINNQLDKLVLSKLLSVSELAIYTVAYTLSMMPVVLAGPIAIAIFPRLTKFYESSSKEKLYSVFNNSFKLVLTLTTVTGVALALYSGFFLEIWTQDHAISLEAMVPTSLLLIGQMLLSYQVIPFNLLLAGGNTKVNIKMGLYGFILLIPMMLLMGYYYGMVGTALSWLIYNLIITPLFVYIVIRKMTEFSFPSWVWAHCFKPISIIVFGMLLFYLIIPNFMGNQMAQLTYILVSSALVFLTAFKFTFELATKNIFKFIRHELFT